MKIVFEGINSAAGSTNKGDAPSSGIFLSYGRIFTGKYSIPKIGALSYDKKRKLSKTCDGDTGPNSKSNQNVAEMKRQRTEKAKVLNKKFRALQRKVAFLEAIKAASEKVVPEKDTVIDSPPVGAGQQMGGLSGRAGRN